MFNAYQTLLSLGYLSVYFVHASVCESVQLDKHSHGNTNELPDERASSIYNQHSNSIISFYLTLNK